MFALLIELVLLPLGVLVSYFGWIARLGPTTAGELAKASHGAAYVVLAGMVAYLLDYLGRLHGIAVFVLIFVAALGLFWLVTGAARIPRGFDSRFGVRAIAKIALGAGIVIWLRQPENLNWAASLTRDVPDGIMGNDFVSFGMLLVAGWCIVTGLTKLLLMLRPRRSSRAPNVHPSPRGLARDAGRVEALDALRGDGGRKLSLDDMEF